MAQSKTKRQQRRIAEAGLRRLFETQGIDSWLNSPESFRDQLAVRYARLPVELRSAVTKARRRDIKKFLRQVAVVAREHAGDEPTALSNKAIIHTMRTIPVSRRSKELEGFQCFAEEVARVISKYDPLICQVAVRQDDAQSNVANAAADLVEHQSGVKRHATGQGNARHTAAVEDRPQAVPPKSIPELVILALWKRKILLSLLVIVVSVFFVWNSLPDEAKMRVVNWFTSASTASTDRAREVSATHHSAKWIEDISTSIVAPPPKYLVDMPIDVAAGAKDNRETRVGYVTPDIQFTKGILYWKSARIYCELGKRPECTEAFELAITTLQPLRHYRQSWEIAFARASYDRGHIRRVQGDAAGALEDYRVANECFDHLVMHGGNVTSFSLEMNLLRELLSATNCCEGNSNE